MGVGFSGTVGGDHEFVFEVGHACGGQFKFLGKPPNTPNDFVFGVFARQNPQFLDFAGGQKVELHLQGSDIRRKSSLFEATFERHALFV